MHCDAEKSYTGQWDNLLFTALGAGSRRSKSSRLGMFAAARFFIVPAFVFFFTSGPCSLAFDGDVSGRRLRVNDEFSPAARKKWGIPRETKFYDPLAHAARLCCRLSEAAWAVLRIRKEILL